MFALSIKWSIKITLSSQYFTFPSVACNFFITTIYTLINSIKYAKNTTQCGEWNKKNSKVFSTFHFRRWLAMAGWKRRIIFPPIFTLAGRLSSHEYFHRWSNWPGPTANRQSSDGRRGGEKNLLLLIRELINTFRVGASLKSRFF